MFKFNHVLYLMFGLVMELDGHFLHTRTNPIETYSLTCGIRTTKVTPICDQHRIAFEKRLKCSTLDQHNSYIIKRHSFTLMFGK